MKSEIIAPKCKRFIGGADTRSVPRTASSLRRTDCSASRTAAITPRARW
jgi:hypothetical protein